MSEAFGRLWKFANTDVSKIFTLDNVKSTAESGEKVFELAEALKEQKGKVKNLAPLVNQISTLFDALNTPWGQIIGASVPFVPIGVNLLKFYLDVTKTDPPLTQTVALITQSAYLSSLNHYLDTHSELAEMLKDSDKEVSKQIGKKIDELADLEFDDKKARFALAFFAQSKLADAFNPILYERLINSGIESSQANDITEQIAGDTNRCIIDSLSEGAEKFNHIKEWYELGGQEKFEWHYSLESYLHNEIQSLPTTQVFDEEFTFQDIYVPLKYEHLDDKGRIDNNQSFILENWVNKQIRNDEYKDQVLVIQAGAGRGKSVFCRMFAEQVWRELHPALTPIFIRLRDIDTFEDNFEKTINTFLSNRDFVKSDDTWLTDRNTNYLFILDGFDELRLEGRSKVGLERFLQQIATFQKQFATSDETGHRIILTGRTIAFQGINLPSNMIQVQLLTMDQQLQNVWLGKWQQVLYNNTEEYPDKTAQDAEEEIIKFTEFIDNKKCPQEVKEELAVEPLLLYLLAAMHRDGEIKLADFGEGTGIQSKITIYQQSFDWVLTKQRDKELQRQITGLSADEFEYVMETILMESALAVVQSGGESANLSMINDRLPKDLACSWKQLQEKENKKTLSTALGAFYIKKDQDGGVEFYHKSFSEFLFAKRIYQSLLRWTIKYREGRRDVWKVEYSDLPWKIYDLLGYGGLSVEIIEYLRGLIAKDEDLPYIVLFDRLQEFYFAWCDGEYIDFKGITHPQCKMQELEPYIADDTKLGQRQVDVFTGYNVMILLFELHRYGQKSDDEKLKQALNFHPCGEIGEDGVPKQRDLLLRLIGYGHCVGTNAFYQIVCPFLSDAYLSGANLYGANLYGANLSGANLYGANLDRAKLRSANLDRAKLRSANLYGADLYGANLSGADLYGAKLRSADLDRAKLRSADLSGADLYGANLDRADLYGANLYGAKLRSANLYGANLYGANLSGANLDRANLDRANLDRADLSGADLSGADLEDIKWSDKTDWDSVRGLETGRNVPEKLKRQLGI